MEATMIKIKNLQQIKKLTLRTDLPEELVNYLSQDLYSIYLWTNYDKIIDFENFHTDLANNGYVAIMDGNETREELETEIGLTGGFQQTIPEEVQIHYFEGSKWRRVLVIYNNSYAMILWIHQYEGFDSYADLAV